MSFVSRVQKQNNTLNTEFTHQNQEGVVHHFDARADVGSPRPYDEG